MKTEGDLRKAAVTQLLCLTRPLNEIEAQLTAFDWDYEGVPVELTRRHLASVLQRYLQAILSAEDIETWANLIEGREDVCFEPQFARQIEVVLNELANPTLTQPLEHQRAQVLLNGLIDDEGRSIAGK